MPGPLGTVQHRPARLIIADGHDLIRASLRSLLAHEHYLTVIGEAADGAGALELYRNMRPDLLLLDLNMPDVDGLAVTRIVKAESPTARVLIVTQDGAGSRMLEALTAGADGYVLKGTSKRELVTAIRVALTGEPLIQSERASHTRVPTDCSGAAGRRRTQGQVGRQRIFDGLLQRLETQTG